MRTTLTLLAFVPALHGCGGGGSPAAPPIAAPAPTPAPAPAPTPTPTPVPTAAVDPGGARLGGLAVPGSLTVHFICSPAPRTFAADGRLVSLANASRIDLFRDEQIVTVSADYTYAYDINGFGGPTFTAADRKGGRAFEIFATRSGGDGTELQLNEIQPLNEAVYGLTTFYDPCFFAGAPSAAPTFPGITTSRFAGYVDGLHQTATDTDRLFGSTAAMDYDAGRGSYTLTLTLASVEDAFAEAAGQSQTRLATATATIVYAPANRGFESTGISAPGGFTGSIVGHLAGPRRNVVVFTFEMVNPAGERIWGVVATEPS